MPRGKKHGPEEVIPKLREAEVLISQGSTQEIAAKQIGVTKQTLIRWRKEYGGFRMDQAKRMKQLEKEDAKLKKLLAQPTRITSGAMTSSPIARATAVLSVC